MYKPFNHTEAFTNFFTLGSAILPTDKSVVYLPEISLKNFLNLDYRISNPRVLSGDNEMKITGDAFSQTQYSNYVLGVVLLKDVLPTDAFYRSDANALGSLKSALKEKIALSLSHSNKLGVSGDMAVFIGDLQEYEVGSVYVPFLVSTSIFYNSHRVSIGTMNSDAHREEIFSSMEVNFNRNISSDVSVYFSHLSPKKVMLVELPDIEVVSMFQEIQEQIDDNDSDNNRHWFSSNC